MNFYAYIPNAEGKEPCGGDRKLIIKDLKTTAGAIRRAIRYLGHGCRVFTFTNFYDEKTFRQVYPR